MSVLYLLLAQTQKWLHRLLLERRSCRLVIVRGSPKKLCALKLHRYIVTDRCLTQKELAGGKERIFLINRTEHPRLAERVRCLCVGCDVTWGPPCQALVTQLPANRRR